MPVRPRNTMAHTAGAVQRPGLTLPDWDPMPPGPEVGSIRVDGATATVHYFDGTDWQPALPFGHPVPDEHQKLVDAIALKDAQSRHIFERWGLIPTPGDVMTHEAQVRAFIAHGTLHNSLYVRGRDPEFAMRYAKACAGLDFLARKRRLMSFLESIETVPHEDPEASGRKL